MKNLLIGLAVFATGCAAAGHTKAHTDKVAWVPCEIEVVAFEDAGKTVSKVMKTQWFCENR